MLTELTTNQARETWRHLQTVAATKGSISTCIEVDTKKIPGAGAAVEHSCLCSHFGGKEAFPSRQEAELR